MTRTMFEDLMLIPEGLNTLSMTLSATLLWCSLNVSIDRYRAFRCVFCCLFLTVSLDDLLLCLLYYVHMFVYIYCYCIFFTVSVGFQVLWAISTRS